MSKSFLILTVLCAGLVARATADEVESPEGVSERVTSLQPKPKEKRFDEIGWADDIRQALSLAKQHKRPVFLFTHDGRINLGRC